MDPKAKNALIAGGLLIAIAVGYFVYSGNKDVTCKITAVGVASIVTGVTHGRDVAQIVSLGASAALVPDACESVVESLVNKPEEPVSIDLQLPTGDTVEQTVPGTELLSPPPPPPSGSVQRIIDCLSWESSVLFRLCVDGTILPRSA